MPTIRPKRGPRLNQIDGHIVRVTADGAHDGGDPTSKRSRPIATALRWRSRRVAVLNRMPAAGRPNSVSRMRLSRTWG
jgi:hypothetical protein